MVGTKPMREEAERIGARISPSSFEVFTRFKMMYEKLAKIGKIIRITSVSW